MTTTVTTTTVTSVTGMGLTVGLGALVTVVLIAFLAMKEITSAAEDERMIRWGQTLSVGIIPLLTAFAVIALTKMSSGL